MQNRSLNDALETTCRRWVNLALHAQAFQLCIQIGNDDVRKFAEIDAASLHDFRGVRIFNERQQEMLQRGVFMRAVASMLQCVMKCGFQRLCK